MPNQGQNIYKPVKKRTDQNQNTDIFLLSFESVRLMTYSGRDWPSLHNIYPTQLARAGFYYDSQKRQLVCFSCSGGLPSEEMSKPMDMHQIRFPHCEFVRGIDTRNIPLYDYQSLFVNVSGSKTGTLTSSPHNSLSNEVLADNRLMSLPPHLGTDRGNVLPSASSTFERHDIAAPRSLGFPQNGDNLNDSNQNKNRAADTDQKAMEFKMKMKYEINRKKSYDTWPVGCPVTEEEAVKAGFYFIGPDDRVKCAFCSGVLCNWAPGDSAMGEHTRYFPKCPFIVNPTGVGNVSIEVTLSETTANYDVNI